MSATMLFTLVSIMEMSNLSWKFHAAINSKALRKIVGLCFALLASSVGAAQLDINGPPGSSTFGSGVTALPNGNIVVVDRNASSNTGAVYLYDTNGNLISTLTGSIPGHPIGPQITVVGNSNFVVCSQAWSDGAASLGGAVTWVNGFTGLSGVVSASNSLVGTVPGDNVSSGAVLVLTNGNYVVLSPDWNNAFGAATWGNGNSGIVGTVSASNSLVGATAGDQIGYSNFSTALSNGNYVVVSPYWDSAATTDVGAVTWGDGSVGIAGVVSASNSLVGTTTGDLVGSGRVTTLNNGNYVVVSSQWNNGAPNQHVGAVTWGNGSNGIAGAVSASNSLAGTTIGDQVGLDGVIALSNGNYVIGSSQWNNSVANAHFGAATWGNGSTGLTGAVSGSNSLIGTTVGDQVGYGRIAALTNGNYVVPSPMWNNGTANSNFGAATWGNGSTGIAGAVSTGNSLLGTTAGDFVGGRVTALSNGNYVVSSTSWNNGIANSYFGAATWGNGSTGIVGAVSASNSLIGAAHDAVGATTALGNGNYVVTSHGWNNNVGAVTWGNGDTGTTGVVSASNSLIGSAPGDQIGSNGIIGALSDGNYVVGSPNWSNGPAQVGAVTWLNGSAGFSGVVSASNSLIGTTMYDNVSFTGILALGNEYVVSSVLWHNGALTNAGAITFASGAFRLKGTIQPWNSVVGLADHGGPQLTYSPDAARHRIVVGRPAENIVSVFTPDQVFASDFDP
jgi:hypothetical protein